MAESPLSLWLGLISYVYDHMFFYESLHVTRYIYIFKCRDATQDSEEKVGKCYVRKASLNFRSPNVGNQTRHQTTVLIVDRLELTQEC